MAVIKFAPRLVKNTSWRGWQIAVQLKTIPELCQCVISTLVISLTGRNWNPPTFNPTSTSHEQIRITETFHHIPTHFTICFNIYKLQLNKTPTQTETPQLRVTVTVVIQLC